MFTLSYRQRSVLTLFGANRLVRIAITVPIELPFLHKHPRTLRGAMENLKAPIDAPFFLVLGMCLAHCLDSTVFERLR